VEFQIAPRKWQLMFVVTFYSFRGGVGRTMALVNIGTWLARHGRRVLLVDFDLESPGISHYALPNAKPERKGVVDYLLEASERDVPRTIEDFYFESFKEKGGGALYVMPAGRASTHQERLETLNFGNLYRDEEGYLIVENLKALWMNEISPDYVLIDSRTGYSEAAGICTRQLADAVVITFIPSPQNLSGLQEVVGQIRAQNAEGWRKEIQLLFLASSIPVIDDEGGEIADSIERAKQQLGFEELLGKVYYTPSAAHLSQKVFTLERENSSLSKNYAEVARALTLENPDDPDGAARFLERLLSRDHAFVRTIRPSRLEDELVALAMKHRGDARVLFALARVRLQQGRLNDALSVLDDVLETDPNATEARILRANIRLQLDMKALAEEDLRNVLSRADLDALQLSRAMLTLQRVSPGALKELDHFASYEALPEEEKASLRRWTTSI
jgi:MinD-like ATPase involved in chromosome partitioning or flagellar assembly